MPGQKSHQNFLVLRVFQIQQKDKSKNSNLIPQTFLKPFNSSLWQRESARVKSESGENHTRVRSPLHISSRYACARSRVYNAREQLRVECCEQASEQANESEMLDPDPPQCIRNKHARHNRDWQTGSLIVAAGSQSWVLSFMLGSVLHYSQRRVPPSTQSERERESTPRRREERKPPANWDEPPFSHANFIARPARRQLVFTPIKIQDPKSAVKTKKSSPHHYQKIGAQINPALLILNRLEKNI